MLIYGTGVRAFKETDVAEAAAYLYMFTNIAIQQLPYCTENTYFFFALLGLFTLY